ncbi:MAG: 3-dehydroquinate synthase [Opitutales bacterium]
MKFEGESLEVGLGDRSYEIVIGRGLADGLRQEVDDLRIANQPVAAVVDAGLASSQRSFLKTALGDLPQLELAPGESTKSLTSTGQIWDFLGEVGMDRTGCLIALGGGVTGDVGGFAASSYLRGIEYLQVPSTLLAMVDSSVGGKTGINVSAGKNLVGAFHQPRQVMADLDLLNTLPATEFSAGMAEVIKYGLLGDLGLFQELEKGERLGPASSALGSVVRKCCLAKAHVVAEDERETAASGGRALLNLGHTFAHAIENVAGYGEYLHGEAVALGLVASTRLSQLLGSLNEDCLTRVTSTLDRYELPITLRRPLPSDSLLDAMRRDKKVRGGKLRFVVMEELGHAVTKDEVPMDLVIEALSTIEAPV